VPAVLWRVKDTNAEAGFSGHVSSAYVAH